MTPRQEQIVKNVDKYRQDILDAERWIWAHPEVGYTEWQTNAYMLEKFKGYGYSPVEAGDIPGFYVDLDTGRPGPTLAIMGELDALDIANHPESVNGMTHCCGHNCQCAEMIGIAAALTEPGAMDGMCGKIRLLLVPAEEMIQLEFRKGLIDKGIIKYLGGKTEFMRRGFFDGVDLALMVHQDNENEYDFTCQEGFNGIIAKILTYKGKSSHAGGSPHDGINAQYAATLGLDGCNALRETFRDKDHIRFHPILKGVKSAVNIIPDEMRIE
ncbi:MAG: amidohydrolase, partial [Firmicutes bacterium]|nr:amidohydrolase [Bacillota bacterium]